MDPATNTIARSSYDYLRSLLLTQRVYKAVWARTSPGSTPDLLPDLNARLGVARAYRPVIVGALVSAADVEPNHRARMVAMAYADVIGAAFDETETLMARPWPDAGAPTGGALGYQLIAWEISSAIRAALPWTLKALGIGAIVVFGLPAFRWTWKTVGRWIKEDDIEFGQKIVRGWQDRINECAGDKTCLEIVKQQIEMERAVLADVLPGVGDSCGMLETAYGTLIGGLLGLGLGWAGMRRIMGW